MRNFLGLLFCLFCFSTVEAQSRRVIQLQIVPEMYTYETLNFVIPDGAIIWADPETKDSILVYGKAFWTNTKAKSSLGVCFTSANPEEVVIDSIEVGVYTPQSQHILKRMLVAGQSEVINSALPLQEGRVVFVREMFRRKHECGAVVWFILVDVEGP